MSHYFFHIQDGSNVLEDPDGQECNNLADAQSEAIASARELMAEDLRAGKPLGLHRAIVIANENGAVLTEVSFQAALPSEIAKRRASEV
jgi:hypothetical protein